MRSQQSNSCKSVQYVNSCSALGSDMAKQWATRVIVAFQSACWCLAILLLLSRGLASLRARDAEGAEVAGVCLVAGAVLMVAASPFILLARAYDRRRYRSVDQFPDLSLPPRYEDVVSRAPSYTSLFTVEETFQLQATDTETLSAPVAPLL